MHILVQKLVQIYASITNIIIVTSKRALNDIFLATLSFCYVLTFYTFLYSSTLRYVLFCERIFIALETTHRLLYTLSKHNFLSVSKIFEKNISCQKMDVTFHLLSIISVVNSLILNACVGGKLKQIIQLFK